MCAINVEKALLEMDLESFSLNSNESVASFHPKLNQIDDNDNDEIDRFSQSLKSTIKKSGQ